jgi:microcystin-dependent protein
MAYNSNLPMDNTADIRENFRALKDDKIVAAATAITADTAVKLANTRKISLEGDATGSVNFDGSTDVSLAVDVLSADTSAQCIGNAATATKLETACNINGVAFDGTVDITITAVANGGNADTLNGESASDIIEACSIYAVPSGAIQHFARTTAPEGWLKANGSTVSRTQYAELFAAVGTLFGAGDGSTTFNLPDLRGEFVRGFDDGRGVDAGRLLGSAQKGTLAVNDPSLTQVTVTSLISADDTTNLIMNQRVGLDNPVSMFDYTGLNNALYNPASSYQSVITNPFAFNFGITRPRNIALLACIKY